MARQDKIEEALIAAHQANARCKTRRAEAQRDELARLLRDCQGFLKALGVWHGHGVTERLNAEITAALAKLEDER